MRNRHCLHWTMSSRPTSEADRASEARFHLDGHPACPSDRPMFPETTIDPNEVCSPTDRAGATRLCAPPEGTAGVTGKDAGIHCRRLAMKPRSSLLQDTAEVSADLLDDLVRSSVLYRKIEIQHSPQAEMITRTSFTSTTPLPSTSPDASLVP